MNGESRQRTISGVRCGESLGRMQPSKDPRERVGGRRRLLDAQGSGSGGVLVPRRGLLLLLLLAQLLLAYVPRDLLRPQLVPHLPKSQPALSQTEPRILQ